MKKRGAIVLCEAALSFILVLAARPASGTDDWPQWGGNPAHTGTAAAPGQGLDAILADFVYDPFVSAELADRGGELLVHYPVPLVDAGGTDVYMELKTGSYQPCSQLACSSWDTEIFHVQKLQWQGGALAPVWRFQTDWRPEPDAGHLNGWEPVFHPALAAGFLWVPGAGGSVFRVDRSTGQGVRVSPFPASGGGLDGTIFVAGGLSAGGNGSIYYNAIRLDSIAPWTADVEGAWLVEVHADGTSRTVPFSTLVPAAPSGTALCERAFSSAILPLPPDIAAAPPTVPCGSQRPGLNAIPAIGADGTIFTVSRAHMSDRYAYVVAVDPLLLKPRWAASLRDRLADGCGILLTPNGTPGGCRDGATAGVDPATNRPPAGRIIDLASSSPVALPDGGVLYGTFTGYNFERGHLMHFDSAGSFAGSYDFGWDITPAVFPHNGAWSVVLKDNHYEVGSYCFDETVCPPETGRYDITSLDTALHVEWSFRATNTESCARATNGTISCVSDHPDGFEWCVNQPAVDSDGVTYVNSEDGYLYAIARDGSLRDKIFLNLALGAAYTPLSIGGNGILYTQNAGHLFAVGRNPRDLAAPAPRPHRTRTLSPREKHPASEARVDKG